MACQAGLMGQCKPVATLAAHKAYSCLFAKDRQWNWEVLTLRLWECFSGGRETKKLGKQLYYQARVFSNLHQIKGKISRSQVMPFPPWLQWFGSSQPIRGAGTKDLSIKMA